MINLENDHNSTYIKQEENERPLFIKTCYFLICLNKIIKKTKTKNTNKTKTGLSKHDYLKFIVIINKKYVRFN